LRVWIMEPGSADLKAFLTRASTEFEQSQAGAKVALQFVPWASAHDQFVTAIGGGQAPDVAEMGSTWTPEFGDIGALVQAGTSLDGYVPSLVEGATVGGKTYGLPYFSTVWAFIYNDELLTKAGFKGKPFSSYPELIDQAKKAKRDGVSKYPILWVAGAGFEQLPGTWFSMTQNRGGAIFDKQLAPQLGAGSVARETLKWWQSTFKEELADPNSLNLRFIPAVKAFNAGQHVYLGTLHHYYISLVNDPAQSPIAGKGRVVGHPGDGKTIGYTMLYMMVSTTKNKEWAWKLLQALGGRTKDGQYTQANRLATDAMLGSGYQSVMDSDLLKKGWAKWADVPTVLGLWSKAANFADVVPAVYQPWYPRWSDAMNVELTACLSGKITPDQACDNMVAAVAKAKRG